MNADTKPRIGFIGIGLMGHGIAKNLVTKGYPLSVRVHRNRKPLEDLVAAGAKEVATNADIARSSDIVFLCVTGTPQIEEIVYGDEGLLSAVRDGQIVARPMMYLALSYDLRLIDGREAVQFLVRIKDCLEAPERILMEI